MHEAMGAEATAVPRWLRDWWKARRNLQSMVHAHLEQAAENMKKRHDSKYKPLTFEPDDLVLLSVKSHAAFEGYCNEQLDDEAVCLVASHITDCEGCNETSSLHFTLAE